MVLGGGGGGTEYWFVNSFRCDNHGPVLLKGGRPDKTCDIGKSSGWGWTGYGRREGDDTVGF